MLTDEQVRNHGEEMVGVSFPVVLELMSFSEENGQPFPTKMVKAVVQARDEDALSILDKHTSKG